MSALILPRSVASSAAEDAEALVNRVVGWYATISVAQRRYSPEFVVLPHIVAVGEEFVREALLDCSENQLAATTQLHAALWSYGEANADRSWPNLRDCWKEWHGVDFAGFIRQSDMLALIDARNTVVHGLGELTRKQTRKDGGSAVIARLSQIGIPVTAGRIDIPPAAIGVAREVVISLITWIDGEIRSRSLWPTVPI